MALGDGLKAWAQLGRSSGAGYAAARPRSRSTPAPRMGSRRLDVMPLEMQFKIRTEQPVYRPPERPRYPVQSPSQMPLLTRMLMREENASYADTYKGLWDAEVERGFALTAKKQQEDANEAANVAREQAVRDYQDLNVNEIKTMLRPKVPDVAIAQALAGRQDTDPTTVFETAKNIEAEDRFRRYMEWYNTADPEDHVHAPLHIALIKENLDPEEYQDILAASRRGDESVYRYDQQKRRAANRVLQTQLSAYAPGYVDTVDKDSVVAIPTAYKPEEEDEDRGALGGLSSLARGVTNLQKDAFAGRMPDDFVPQEELEASRQRATRTRYTQEHNAFLAQLGDVDTITRSNYGRAYDMLRQGVSLKALTGDDPSLLEQELATPELEPKTHQQVMDELYPQPGLMDIIKGAPDLAQAGVKALGKGIKQIGQGAFLDFKNDPLGSLAATVTLPEKTKNAAIQGAIDHRSDILEGVKTLGRGTVEGQLPAVAKATWDQLLEGDPKGVLTAPLTQQWRSVKGLFRGEQQIVTSATRPAIRTYLDTAPGLKHLDEDWRKSTSQLAAEILVPSTLIPVAGQAGKIGVGARLLNVGKRGAVEGTINLMQDIAAREVRGDSAPSPLEGALMFSFGGLLGGAGPEVFSAIPRAAKLTTDSLPNIRLKMDVPLSSADVKMLRTRFLDTLANESGQMNLSPSSRGIEPEDVLDEIDELPEPIILTPEELAERSLEIHDTLDPEVRAYFIDPQGRLVTSPTAQRHEDILDQLGFSAAGRDEDTALDAAIAAGWVRFDNFATNRHLSAHTEGQLQSALKSLSNHIPNEQIEFTLGNTLDPSSVNGSGVVADLYNQHLTGVPSRDLVARRIEAGVVARADEKVAQGKMITGKESIARRRARATTPKLAPEAVAEIQSSRELKVGFQKMADAIEAKQSTTMADMERYDDLLDKIDVIDTRIERLRAGESVDDVFAEALPSLRGRASQRIADLEGAAKPLTPEGERGLLDAIQSERGAVEPKRQLGGGLTKEEKNVGRGVGDRPVGEMSVSERLAMFGRKAKEAVTGGEEGAVGGRKAIEEARLSRELAGAKPRFNIGQESYTPEFASDIDKALYIVAQKNPSRRDADYMNWLREQLPDVDDRTLRALGSRVKAHVKDTIQSTGDAQIPPSNLEIGGREAAAPVASDLQARIRKVLEPPAPPKATTPTGRLKQGETVVRKNAPDKSLGKIVGSIAGTKNVRVETPEGRIWTISRGKLTRPAAAAPAVPSTPVERIAASVPAPDEKLLPDLEANIRATIESQLAKGRVASVELAGGGPPRPPAKPTATGGFDEPPPPSNLGEHLNWVIHTVNFKEGSDAFERLAHLVRSSERLTPERKAVIHAEQQEVAGRLRRVAEEKIKSGASDQELAIAMAAAKKGSRQKPLLEPMADKFTDDEKLGMRNALLEAWPLERGPHNFDNALAARDKLLGGYPLAPYEIKLLAPILPVNAIEKLTQVNNSFRKIVGREALAIFAGLFRALQTPGDVSIGFRQLKRYIARWPKEWGTGMATATKVMFAKPGANRQAAQLVADSIVDDPLYKVVNEDMGVAVDGAEEYATRGGTGRATIEERVLTDADEAYVNRILKALPVLGPIIQRSQAGYTLGLAKARMDVAKRAYPWLRSLGKTPEQIKEYGSLINVASGRGSLGPAEKYGTLMSTLLYAPRLVASQVELPWKVIFSKDKHVRLEAARILAGDAGLTAGILGLAHLAGADIELDPRSADWGKIKVGPTRIDATGGSGAYIRLAARMAGQTLDDTMGIGGGGIKTELGDIDKISIQETIERFAETKEAPGVALLHDFLQGETFTGEKLDWSDVTDPEILKREAFNRMTPLMVQSVAEAIREGDAWPGALLSMGEFFGASTQTYTPQSVMIAQAISKDIMNGHIDVEGDYGHLHRAPRTRGELNPRDSREFEERHKNLIEEIADKFADQEKTGATLAFEEGKKIETKSTAKIERLAERYNTGEITGKDFREGLSEVENDSRAQREIISAILEEAGYDSDERPDVAGPARDLYDYVQLFNKYPDADTDPDQKEALFDAIAEFRADIGMQREAEMDSNLHLGMKQVPLYNELAADKKVLRDSGYFDRTDEAWAETRTFAADHGETLPATKNAYERSGIDPLRDKWLDVHERFSDRLLHFWKMDHPEELSLAIKWGYKDMSREDQVILERAGRETQPSRGSTPTPDYSEIASSVGY